jgi:hypothetical protein
MVFESLIKKGYCVVGNSPCEVGVGNGKKIDSFENIIRFNDFSIKKEFQYDYGAKVNIWIRGTNDKIVYTVDEKKKLLDSFDLIVIRADRDRNRKFKNYLKKRNIYFEFFPPGLEGELGKKIGHCPSTGLLTLYWIYKIFGIIEPEKVFGFSFCKENRNKDPLGGQVHYYNNNDLLNPETNKIERIKGTFLKSKHNWAAEEFFYKDLINKRA